MHKLLTNLCLGLALAMAAGAASALEFRAALKHGVVMYDTPSDKGRKVYVLSRGTPLEIFAEQNNWVRVRDQGGTLAWVPKQDIGTLNTVQVTRQTMGYRDADGKSPVIFRAEPTLLLDLISNTKTGWLKVKHRDGLIGFVRIEDVWGL